MTRFIIFRHGQTDWNLERRVMGKIDIPLNNLGRTQAKKLANRLRNELIDVFYSSPLKRAKETVDIVAATHNKPVIILPELIEINFGKYEGKTKAERVSLFPRLDVTNDILRKQIGIDTFGDIVPKAKNLVAMLLKKIADNRLQLELMM